MSTTTWSPVPKMVFPVLQSVRFVSSPKRTPTKVSSTAVDMPLKEQPEQPPMVRAASNRSEKKQ
jgi:hypothetical protein